MSQKQRPLVRDFLTVGTGTIAYMVVGIIGTPIITRLVDPNQYGRVSMLNTYSSIGLMLCMLGLDQTLLRYFYHGDITYQRELIRRCVGISVGIVLLAGAVLLVISSFGKGLPNVVDVALYIATVVGLLINRFAHLLLRLRQHTKMHSVVNVLNKLLYIVFAVVAISLLRENHYEILVVSAILSSVLTAAIAIYSEHDLWKLSASTNKFTFRNQDLIRYGFPFMIASGINVIFAAMDKLFINHYCSMEDVGVYASALNLMAIFSVIKSTFNTLWMPAAVKHYENDQSDRTFYQRANSYISLLMLCFGAGVVLFKDVLVLLLGTKYQSAVQVVPFLMFEPILNTISETTGTGIILQKKSQYQVMVASGACMVNLIGNWVLTPLLGVKGAAISTGISYFVYWAIRTYLSNKVFYVNYRIRRFLATLFVLVLYATLGTMSTSMVSQISAFVIVIAVFLTVYRAEMKSLFAMMQGSFGRTN